MSIPETYLSLLGAMPSPAFILHGGLVGYANPAATRLLALDITGRPVSACLDTALLPGLTAGGVAVDAILCDCLLTLYGHFIAEADALVLLGASRGIQDVSPLAAFNWNVRQALSNARPSFTWLEAAAKNAANDPSARAHLNRIYKQQFIFHRLADSAEEYCRLQSDAVLRLDDVDLPIMLGDLVTQAAPFAALAGATVRAELPKKMLWRCDTARLERAVLHLLCNAIQHGGAGVEVVLRLEELEGAARVTVSDNGMGMENTGLAALLSGDAPSPASPGFGLRLCSAAARLHGGFLMVSTRLGGGFSATMRLPLPHDPAMVLRQFIQPFVYDYGAGLDHTLLILSPAIPGDHDVFTDGFAR
jgi:anti-sigma regulatory factor (Ser/Thr protein kinase)